MLVAMSKASTWVFTSAQDDSPEDEKTKFTLGSLDSNVRAYIGDNAVMWHQQDNGEVNIQNKGATQNLNAVLFGLRGIENFKDEEGHDVLFKTVKRSLNGQEYDVVHKDVLDRIPPGVMAEIGQEILNKNTLTEKLRKKS